MGASSNHKKQFSAHDIERYHAGLLSAAEMHALEKAALDDPFLADALEGYVHTATPQKDLELLKKRLLERSRKRRSILYLLNTPAFRIAALVLVLAGSGWIIYSGMQKKTSNIALERTTDSSTVKHQFTDSSETNNQTQTLAKDAGKTSHDTINQVSDAIVNNMVSTHAKVSEKNKADRSENVKPIEQPIQENKEVAIHINEQPEKSTTLIQDTNDSLSLAAGKQNTVNANAFRFKSQAMATSSSPVSTLTNDTIKNLNIMLKPLPDSTQPEVVVVGYGAKKKKGPRPITIVDTLEPAEGWSSYNDYVVSNLKSPEDLHMKPISGEVELSFDINKDGEPVNIAVVKSLCDKCDDEAIRLLKEGPKWKKKKKGKGKIAIRF
jgi:outer membrane biosynthesis protein TonB